MTTQRAHAGSVTLVLLLLVLVMMACSGARAQYYEEREFKSRDTRFVYAGVLQRNFVPRGSNNAPDSSRIDYTRLMPMIGFRQGAVDIYVGYTKFDQHGKSNAAIVVGTVVATEFPVSGRGRTSALMMPLMFAADFTKAESGGPERDNFNIASLGLGAGLTYRLSLESVDFSLHAGELFQYATQGLSVGSGFSAATLADATVILRDIGFEGLTLGYRFRLQTWAMSDTRFDYRSVAHGPYIGVLF
jgi:hypothetical protein